jgi:channel protein (hemolysin III family)
MDTALTPVKPRWRGRIHQVAFFVSIPAGIALVVLAEGWVARVAALIYACSLTAVFGSSAAYHRGKWSPKALRRMKRLDHSMIFVLIAGTYTPVALLVLHGPWQVVLLDRGTLAAGIMLKSCDRRLPSSRPRLHGDGVIAPWRSHRYPRCRAASC